MQCECGHGDYKDNMERCSNEATETVATPYGNFQMCAECAEETRGYLKYMVHGVPSRPSVELQGLANALGAILMMEREDRED